MPFQEVRFQKIGTLTPLYAKYRLTKNPIFTIHVGRGNSLLIEKWFGFLKIIKHR